MNSDNFDFTTLSPGQRIEDCAGITYQVIGVLDGMLIIRSVLINGNLGSAYAFNHEGRKIGDHNPHYGLIPPKQPWEDTIAKLIAHDQTAIVELIKHSARDKLRIVPTIKAIRQLTGAGLVEAKAAYEWLQKNHPYDL